MSRGHQGPVRLTDEVTSGVYASFDATSPKVCGPKYFSSCLSLSNTMAFATRKSRSELRFSKQYCAPAAAIESVSSSGEHEGLKVDLWI